MQINIRQERYEDYATVENLIESAFKSENYSDPTEHILVSKLRKSNAFIPELSLVAEFENTVVGHILLTKIKIIDLNKSFDSLALAPVSVLPDYQSKGIGGQLIIAAHKKSKELGYTSIVLVGHAGYYPRFGYTTLSAFNISLPLPAPDENCMVIELIKGSLNNVSGIVEYDEAFGLSN